MKKVLWIASLCVGIGCAGAAAIADDDFPLYRGIGTGWLLVTNGTVDDAGHEEVTVDGPGDGAVATGTATIIPDADEWVTLAQVDASAAGLGNHAAVGGTAMCAYSVLDNAQNSPYGAVSGIATTLISGTGAQVQVTIVTSGNGGNGFMITENGNGVFVTFNGDPITITGAGGGIPLELTLPASPGDTVTLGVNAVLQPGNNGDQGSASVGASVVPVSSLPLPAAVVRDEFGDIVDSWVLAL